MINLPPQAVAPAGPPTPAAPPPRHRSPEAPRASFSQTLEGAVNAEARPPEPSRAPARPAQGADSARERRLANAARPSEPGRPEPEAAGHPPASAGDSAEAANTQPADEDSPAAPDNLGALLAQLRLSLAGAKGGLHGAVQVAEQGNPGADGPGAGGPSAQRPAAAGSRQEAQAGVAEGADRAAAAGLAAAAGGAPAAAFEDHLARASVVTSDPTVRPGEALPAGAAPWNAGGAAAPGLVATASTAPAQAALPAHPGSADFGNQLGAQITTFVREGVEHAQLHLNPADLGPVSVRIQLEGATAVVQLGADQASTRQALEQAMPMLAASLREAGLTLTGGGVFDQARPGNGADAGAAGRERGEGRDGRDGRDGREGGAGPAGPGTAEARTGPDRRRGVVDLIA